MNIRVNCISPSAILTERTAQHMPEVKRAKIAALHPLKRLGTPADVAAAALFLVSNSASWITGATLDIAGGRLMH
jgi:3-oxoacyl-[acyl-carrier protein] reductase